MPGAFPSRSALSPLARRRPVLLVAILLLTSGSGPAVSAARSEQVPLRQAAAPQLQDLVREASSRFGVPVMAVESHGRADALSPKGAIGLMQVMPETYASLAARYGLGADPWNPHDNVLAGAAYLRELFDRFGSPGFLVAYNAGPGRWDDYRLRARPLPAETVAYITRLAPVVGGGALPALPNVAMAAARRPSAAPIFVQLSSIAAHSTALSERERVVRIIEANATVAPPMDGLFVASSQVEAQTSTSPSIRSGDPLVATSDGPKAAARSPLSPLFVVRTATDSTR